MRPPPRLVRPSVALPQALLGQWSQTRHEDGSLSAPPGPRLFEVDWGERDIEVDWGERDNRVVTPPVWQLGGSSSRGEARPANRPDDPWHAFRKPGTQLGDLSGVNSGEAGLGRASLSWCNSFQSSFQAPMTSVPVSRGRSAGRGSQRTRYLRRSRLHVASSDKSMPLTLLLPLTGLLRTSRPPQCRGRSDLRPGR